MPCIVGVVPFENEFIRRKVKHYASMAANHFFLEKNKDLADFYVHFKVCSGEGYATVAENTSFSSIWAVIQVSRLLLLLLLDVIIAPRIAERVFYFINIIECPYLAEIYIGDITFPSLNRTAIPY